MPCDITTGMNSTKDEFLILSWMLYAFFGREFRSSACQWVPKSARFMLTLILIRKGSKFRSMDALKQNTMLFHYSLTLILGYPVLAVYWS